MMDGLDGRRSLEHQFCPATGIESPQRSQLGPFQGLRSRKMVPWNGATASPSPAGCPREWEGQALYGI